MSVHMTYDQYFDVNEKYFPCIDDSAIKGGARWDDTYPHSEFIKLLYAAENMLGGSTNRSIWIHGAYGTGKSKCAYALKKILEVPEQELNDYWNSFDTLKKEKDLLAKIEGYRKRGIVTVYRYATGGITTPEKFFFAIQESIREALKKNDNITYMGENTLKENVIKWIEEDQSHRHFLDELLQKPIWRAKFAQSNSEEILSALNKQNGDIKGLMSNIFDLSEKERITAMSLDADGLKNWIRDVVKKNNNIKIVFFWDEFSKFFENNKYSLDEFQKIVALCQEVPFYFVIVTHRTASIVNSQDESWKIVQQRFNQVEITLPNNIAFELIGQAFKAKPAAAEAWSHEAETLNKRLEGSRNAVMHETHITNPKVMKDIMPIHPMAALVLKNIAEAFASNQRSMFDFIKVKDNSKAFQWFISNYGPKDDHPLLTIDMLWDFFYEKGKDNLSPDIRMILDTYPQQKNLRDDEQRVLKTVLIMQAIDKRTGGSLDVVKPTDQNLSYAFEGITSSGLDTRSKNIAKGLCSKGILVQNPIGNNKYAYGVAVLAGDQARIDEAKRKIRKQVTTASLVAMGNLGTCLSLSPALRLRFADDKGALPTVTVNNFTKTVNQLKNQRENGYFTAVIALSMNDVESKNLQEKIKAAVANDEYKNIIFIDATYTPLGDDNLDSYIDYAALAEYYLQSNSRASRDNDSKAKLILSNDWRERLYNGKFVVYSHDHKEGETVIGGKPLEDVLKAVVLRRFPNIPDFGSGATESQFKIQNPKHLALCGIIGQTSGMIQGAEKYALKGVWGKDAYWKNPETSSLPISIIKVSVDEFINSRLKAGKPVSIAESYSFLQDNYGYVKSNLTAFMMGFLLKEYSLPQYRYLDQNGAQGEMSPEKLAELIGYFISKNTESYIVKMTPEEKAFNEITAKAWGIDENALTSPAKAASLVKKKMQDLKLPVWSLENIDDEGAYDVIKKYITLVQKEGADLTQVVNEIGKEAMNVPDLSDKLKDKLTINNCRKGMLDFIKHFESGKLQSLVQEIKAKEDNVLDDIENLFSVEFASLWNKETGKDQVRKLITDYTYVKMTREILNTEVSSRQGANKAWRDKLGFVICSGEALQDEFPRLKSTFEFLKKIANDEEIFPDQMRSYVEDLKNNRVYLEDYLNDEESAFIKIYKPYLDGLDNEEVSQLSSAPGLHNIFKMSRTASNANVKTTVNEFKRNQTKTKVLKLWRDKTGTKSPFDWSSKKRTPILLMVPEKEYSSAKKTFDLINRGNGTEEELIEALDYLKVTDIYDNLNNKDAVNNAFRSMLKNYSSILSDLEKVRDQLESLPVDAYDWDTNPSVSKKIGELAKAEYEAGGSDKVLSKIQSMDDKDLRNYLISLVKSNITIGLAILKEGE